LPAEARGLSLFDSVETGCDASAGFCSLDIRRSFVSGKVAAVRTSKLICFWG
jgi:hypothetical protein